MSPRHVWGDEDQPLPTTRGWGPWRRDWYSICSAHQNGGPDDECQQCRAGLWRNRWRQFFGHIVYKLFPRFWRWWANR